MRLQESGEMYLEAILVLSRKLSHVRSVDVSEYLGYSKPSVSRAVGLLKNGEYIIVDYKSNMADEQRLQQLAEHYGLQMQLYRMALEKITGKRVAQCCLWFLRQEREFAIY